MAKYGRNAHAIAALVREAEVHRDVYVDPEIFELEMEHMFPNSWVYFGHASQPAQRPECLVRSRPIDCIRSETRGRVLRRRSS